VKLVSARAAALRILMARAEIARASVECTYPLAQFQRDGAQRAAAILEQYGGVIIADSVGLGKTYIAAALIEQATSSGGHVAVVVPASIRPAWRRALHPIVLQQHTHPVQLISHGQLSRGYASGSDLALAVVDEAHAFRNPRTRRYRALRLLCRASNVVLLTATPVNNSLADLLAQVSIFARDDSFRDLGIPCLSCIFDDPPDRRAIDRLRQAIIIRRDRAELRRRYSEVVLPTGEALEFPRSVVLTTISHTPLVSAADIESFFAHARFAVYRSDYNRALLGLSLLKRIQSGSHAAIVSVERLIAFHLRFLDALRAGRFLHARSLSREDDDQLALHELLLPTLPREMDKASLRYDVESDLAELKAFRAHLARAGDAKAAALVDLLASRPHGARTVVFSEFRDTAEQLWRLLLPAVRVGLVTGAGAYLGTERCGRAEVIRNFAPMASHAPEPPPTARVDVLIATDVMAEGMNLQDADAVISYDLPWNPVRLIQRAGRIDRIGSPHRQIRVYNFLPSRDLDRLLGLVKRLRQKLHDLQSTVGHDRAVLEDTEISVSFLAALRAGDSDVLREVAIESAPTHDKAGAGPVGCVASASDQPQRVLACFSAGFAVRELIWDGKGCMEDKAASEQIMAQALDSNAVHRADVAAQGVTACHAYLTSQIHLPAMDSAIASLGNAIRRSLFEYGLAATPDLIALAEATLAELAGCLDPVAARSEVRSARTPEELFGVLRHLHSQCRPHRNDSPSWRLIAAIAAN
jgi:superfamily II DNA or RNA helicase